MNKTLFTHRLRLVGLFTTLLVAAAGCKKEEEAKNPLLACRPAGGGNGVGTANPRTVMFWTKQNLNCGALSLISIRNTETNSPSYGGSISPTITQYFATQPACGTAGNITIQVSKGYEYEYTIACSGRQWKDKFTADCSDDCIAILLQ